MKTFVNETNDGRIKVEDTLIKNEYDYYFGDKKDVLVVFCYTNIKAQKETERNFTYHKAIKLARERRLDGRYKNYEFYIYL